MLSSHLYRECADEMHVLCFGSKSRACSRWASGVPGIVSPVMIRIGLAIAVSTIHYYRRTGVTFIEGHCASSFESTTFSREDEWKTLTHPGGESTVPEASTIRVHVY